MMKKLYWGYRHPLRWIKGKMLTYRIEKLEQKLFNIGDFKQ